MASRVEAGSGSWWERNVLQGETYPEPDYLGELPDDYLECLDIPALYHLIHEHLDRKGVLDQIKGNIDFRKALVKGWITATLKAHVFEGMSHREINRLIMQSEAGFIRDLQQMGVHVNVESELSREKLASKPHLLMSTHQGGGLETYVLAELLRRGGVKDYRYVMKNGLVDLPIVGKTIASRKPILVHRAELKNGDERKQAEITRVGEEIVEGLAGGENVLFFFEGTRSETGEIAHRPKRQAWCRDLNAAIVEAAKKYPGLDYGKALVVLDMLSVLPEAVEEKPLARVRTNGDCTVKILDAANLSLEENPADPYDDRTLYGKSRSTLKKTLIDRIHRYQKETPRRAA